MRKKLRKLFRTEDLKFVTTAVKYAEGVRRYDGPSKKTYQRCRWFTDKLDPIYNRALDIYDAIPHDKEINKLLDEVEWSYRTFLVHMLDYRAGQTFQIELYE